MTQRSKAAGIALVIIAALTISKFFLYWISGSLAVLSEAWHSIADIGTTILVFSSIILQEKKGANAKNPDTFPEKSIPANERTTHFLSQLFSRIHSVNAELKVAVLIGVLLTGAALSLFAKAIIAEKVVVSAPLMTGLIFIGLSFGSYFLARFEECVGNAEDSVALIADSRHNRADMAISLLTGISLILYHFRFNVDRLVGIIISLYILTFALELSVNSVRAIIKGRQKISFDYTITSIIWKACRFSTYRTYWLRLENRLQFSVGLKRMLRAVFNGLQKTVSWAIGVGAAGLLIWYCSTIFYTVKSNEKALLLRFGSLVNGSRDIGPGLHVKLPYPIDQALCFDTETIQSLVVGNSTTEETAMIWNTEHGDTKAFISGDNNLFLPYIIVHYRIKNYHKYYLGFEENIPEKMLSSLSLQLLNHAFSTTAFYDLILEKRKIWTEQIRDRLQKQSDELGIGVEIVSFCLRDLHPPIDLAESFENVVAAGQLKATSLNYAERKADAVLSRERVDRERTIREAKSYVIEKEEIAEGEATNYHLRYQVFQQDKDMVKTIMYLKTAAVVLNGKKMVLVDPKTGIAEDLLYMENFVALPLHFKGSDLR